MRVRRASGGDNSPELTAYPPTTRKRTLLRSLIRDTPTKTCACRVCDWTLSCPASTMPPPRTPVSTLYTGRGPEDKSCFGETLVRRWPRLVQQGAGRRKGRRGALNRASRGAAAVAPCPWHHALVILSCRPVLCHPIRAGEASSCCAARIHNAEEQSQQWQQ